MKPSHLLPFLCAALFVLSLGMVRQSNAQMPGHVYELRVYHALPGKLDALVARFRDGTERIFQKHDIHTIGYWVPQDNKDNVLIYIVQHNSKADAVKNWAAFNTDPEWVKLKASTETGGPLTSGIDSTYMDALDFSRLK